MRRLVLLALLLASRPEAEEHRAVRLTYAPAPGLGCPDEQSVRDMVSSRLGYDPFLQDAAAEIVATIRQDGRVLRAQVESRDPAGRRSGGRALVSPRHDCRELASTMALAISIAIDPLRFAAAPSAPAPPPPAIPVCPPPAPAPACPACPICPAPPPAAPPARSPEPARTSRTVHPRVLAGVLGSLGTAPAPAFGLTLQLGLRVGDFSIGIEGRGDLAASSDGPAGRRVSAAPLLGSILPCYHVKGIVLCLLATAGVLRGASLDADVRRSAATPWVALGGRLAYELKVYRAFGLAAHLDVQGNLLETALRVDGVDVWVAPVVSGALGLLALGEF